jgi:beta-lactamase regulating signal transducer with metallopeptidase domain/protocatechuate 3,4-dioxygenase beta subunit
MDAILELLARPSFVLALDVTGKSTLVLAVAGLITLALRRASAATRHLVWCLAFCGVVALPTVTLLVPGWAWPIVPARRSTAFSPPAAPVIPTAARSTPWPNPHPPGPRAANTGLPFHADLQESGSHALRADRESTTPDAVMGGPRSPAPALSAWTWLVGVWLAVALAILAVPLVGRIVRDQLTQGTRPIHDGPWATLLHDLALQLGLARRVTLLRSDLATMPMTWGSRRPVILLPASADDWPAPRRRDVLLHELAHIKRLDCLTQAVAHVACALYWFNPLAWFAARRLRIERERACDDLVLMMGSRATDYADHLVALARALRSPRRQSLAALAMARPSQLEGRLLAILDSQCPRRGLTRQAVVLGLMAVVGVTGLLSVVHLGVRVAEAGPPPIQAAPSSRATGPEDKANASGRVVDPQGKPVPDARVVVLASRRKRVSDRGKTLRNQLAGTATTDAEGRFQIDFPTIPPVGLESLKVIAAAPGMGLDGSALKTDVNRQETTVRLDPEKIIESRLVDVQGQPVAGVSVQVRYLNIRSNGYEPYDPRGNPTLWPAPATTDQTGRFQLRGLSARAAISLEIDDPRFAHQTLRFEAGDDGRSRMKTLSLAPAQAIEVRVVRADDGQPMAGVWVNVRAERRHPYSWGETTDARTDDQGRVRIVPWSGDTFSIWAIPPKAQPYLPWETDLKWPKGAIQKSAELKLKRGVVVRGRLTEEPSGAPVAGAGIFFYQTHRNNPQYLFSLPQVDGVSGPDGAFTMVLPHGPGHLLVRGPSADYLHVATSFGEMGAGIRPSFLMYPDALARLDLKPDETTHDVALRLRRGVTIQGRVTGPDGQPVDEAFAFGRNYAPYQENRFDFVPFNGSAPRIPVRDGRFEIPGCDPEKPSTFYFLDVKNQLGATVVISGRMAATGPITVQLQKCASARLLLKGTDGKPIVDRVADEFPGRLTLIITPGPAFGGPEHQKNPDLTTSDEEYQVNLDRDRDRDLRTGPDGRVTFVTLIPGAPYRFRGHEFTPEPGKTIDLPDITVPLEK